MRAMYNVVIIIDNIIFFTVITFKFTTTFRCKSDVNDDVHS